MFTRSDIALARSLRNVATRFAVPPPEWVGEAISWAKENLTLREVLEMLDGEPLGTPPYDIYATRDLTYMVISQTYRNTLAPDLVVCGKRFLRLTDDQLTRLRGLCKGNGGWREGVDKHLPEVMCNTNSS